MINKALDAAAQAYVLREAARRAKAAGKDAATIEALYGLPMRQCASAALKLSKRQGDR